MMYVSIVYQNIASTYKALGDYRLAIKFYEDSINIRDILHGTKMHYFNSKNYYNLGEIYYKQANFAKSIEQYNQSLKIQKLIHDNDEYHPHLMMLYQLIAESYKKNAQDEEALTYFCKIIDGQQAIEKIYHLKSAGAIYYQPIISKLENKLKLYKTIYHSNPTDPEIMLLYQELCKFYTAQLKHNEYLVYEEDSQKKDNAHHIDLIQINGAELIGADNVASDEILMLQYYKMKLALLKIFFQDNLNHPDVIAAQQNLSEVEAIVSDTKILQDADEAQVATEESSPQTDAVSAADEVIADLTGANDNSDPNATQADGAGIAGEATQHSDMM